MDAEELLSRINSGAKLKPAEVAELVALLEAVDLQELGVKLSVDDIYSLLLVVGKTKEFHYRPLLEKYLDAEDSLTVSLLLETLCLEWGPIEEYLEKLIIFTLGMSWDEDDDLRQTAIKILGEFLYEDVGKNRVRFGDKLQSKIDKRSPRIIELLLGVLEDEKNQRVTRQHSYFSLCRAYGKPWEEIPSEYARLDFSALSGDVDWHMLDELKGIAGKQ